MTRFVLHILLFSVLLLAFRAVQFGLTLHNLNGNDSSNYYGRNSAKARIILVGSSNLDYNYDYDKLNSHFTEYDVIGCNLNEPSGLYATLHKLQKLKPVSSDIIIFCLPHSLYEPDKLIPLGIAGQKGFEYSVIKNSLTEFPRYFAKSVFNIKTSDTFKALRSGPISKTDSNTLTFNAHTEADSISDFAQCKTLNGPFNIVSSSFDKDYLVEIKNYIDQCFPSRIAFRFPAVKPSEYIINSERLVFLDKSYPFINNFEESIYPDQYWFNQWYHLNFCGRKVSTDKLIQELSVIIDER